MKKQIFVLTIGLSLIALGLNAQQHEHKSSKTHDHEAMNMTYDVPDSFKEQLRNVYTEVLGLNSAFVSADANQINKNVESVNLMVSKIDMSLVKDDAHMTWMMHLKDMKSALIIISEETDINSQRIAFDSFNQVLFKSIKSFGVSTDKVYYQYCPMANNSKGAYWLSDSKEITNPYLGNMMLHCGSTKEVLN